MTTARPFAEFMEDVLYGPHGFYRTGGAAGRRGDFITSPEVGPLFGAVVANFLDAEWERIGRPSTFTVVDAGAGPGTLARSVLAAEPTCVDALRYIAVERSPEQRERHPAGVESLPDLPDGPLDGVVLANELLDNLPFRLVVHDGAWCEAYVEREDDGRVLERLVALAGAPPVQLPGRAPHGARAPIIERAADWVGDARSRLASGTVVAFDYCVATTAELALRPWREWLRTYREHERGGHYLAEPGRQDITVDVPIDQLPTADAISDQASWLRAHGIDELVAEGKRAWTANASAPDLTALRMRSRVGEAEALLDPSGLGGFTVIEWRA